MSTEFSKQFKEAVRSAAMAIRTDQPRVFLGDPYGSYFVTTQQQEHPFAIFTPAELDMGGSDQIFLVLQGLKNGQS